MLNLYYKLLSCLLLVSIAVSPGNLLAQADLNDPATFLGSWDGSVTFKSFSVTQVMNIEIQKSRSPDEVKVIIFHAKENKIKSDTMLCKFENGVIKLNFNTRSISNSNDFCTGFLNLALLDEKNINGSFETEKGGCSAADYIGKRKSTNETVAANNPVNDTPQPTVEDKQAVEDEKQAALASEQAEAGLMKSCGNVKRKNKSVIELKLANGKTVLLKNEFDKGDYDERTVRYSFDGCITEMQLYKFSIGYAETEGYMLINMLNGKQYFLCNAPKLSPDNKRLIATQSGADPSGYSENHLEIWRYTNGQLINEYAPEKMKWSPASAEWKDNSNIVIQTEEYNGDELKKLKPKTLSFSNNKWSVK